MAKSLPHNTQELDSLLTKPLPDFLLGAKGLLFACSGGADSTALIHLLMRHPELGQVRKELIHFNFGLRGDESDADQAFVESLAKQYQIPVHIELAQEKPEKNIQAWARKFRIKSFERFKRDSWIIVLAHHKDDLAENVLLRMIRGVGPGSLLGMQEWNPPYWRPLLLDYTRKDIQAWLNANAFLYREDSSNGSLKYSRNRIRHELIPLLLKMNPQAIEHVIRCARETRDFVDFAHESPVFSGERNPSLDREQLERLPRAVAYELLSCHMGKMEPVEINHNILEGTLNSLLRTSQKKSRKLTELPKDRSLVLDKGRVTMVQGAKTREKPRSRQHRSAIFLEPRKVILGPAAIVDFFPVTAGTVLDQNCQVRNPDLVAKTFNGF